MLLCAVLPFAAYAMRLLNTDVHDLMCYAVWLLYYIPLLIHKWASERETAAGRQQRGVVAALLLFIIFSYIQTDNAVYVKKKVESEATLSLMTEVMEQVDRTEGYVPGETRVAFVGSIAQALQDVPGTERLNGISGCNNRAAITYETTYQTYFDNVMLRKVNVAAGSTVAAMPEVTKMPGYPQEGYVRKLDNTVVVKWN